MTTPYSPRRHDTVKDRATGRTGRVMGFEGPYVQLRPLGGGVEWDAEAGSLEPVAFVEALSAGVADANARSRGGEGGAAVSFPVPVARRAGIGRAAVSASPVGDGRPV